MLTMPQKAGDLMTHMTTFEDAQKLYKKYGTRSPFEIIDAVPDMKLWMSEAYPADGLRGFATIQNRIRYAVVNSFLQPEEQRIVAAHELGHLIRHEVRLRIQPMQDFDVYAATGKLEREANFFAADLLIDDEETLDEIHSCGADFFSVARKLYVPAPFFAFKLYSLVERGNTMRMPVSLDSSFLSGRR